jgi:hypothetical protein
MSAVISPCGKYRYLLERTWGIGLPRVTWIMLNPSTADAEKDDPTIRRCIGFSKEWGYGGLYVVNLFAWRATDPGELKRVLRPVGPENDHYIGHAAANCKEIVAAWGAHGSFQDRDKVVRKLLKGFGITALSLTTKGSPGHPLYLSANAQRIPWVKETEVPGASGGGPGPLGKNKD